MSFGRITAKSGIVTLKLCDVRIAHRPGPTLFRVLRTFQRLIRRQFGYFFIEGYRELNDKVLLPSKSSNGEVCKKFFLVLEKFVRHCFRMVGSLKRWPSSPRRKRSVDMCHMVLCPSGVEGEGPCRRQDRQLDPSLTSGDELLVSHYLEPQGIDVEL